jgi:hypothetical protein
MTTPMPVPTDTLAGDDYLAAYFKAAQANNQSVWIACHTRNYEIAGRVDSVEDDREDEYAVSIALLDEDGEILAYRYVRFDEIENYDVVENLPTARDYAPEVTAPESASRARLRDRVRGWLR